MINYIITRFSILDFKSPSFNLTRNNSSDYIYKLLLFDEERLNYKFNSFSKVTLPSIINQTYKNYIWIIYTSIYLPPNFKKKLLNLTKDYKKIKIKFVKNFKEFYDDIELILPKNLKYSTIRIDDDDGLSLNFLEELQKYRFKNNVIISFPNGTRIKIEDNKIVYGKPFKKKNIAIGLCAINKNIYKYNHSKINQDNEVIYNYKNNMYLINCSPFCDTNRKFI